MKHRIVVLLILLTLCFTSAAFAKDADLVPGYTQGDAASINTGVKYHCQADNQPLWFRFKAPVSGACTLSISSLSLRYYSNATNQNLSVPAVISNRYGVTAAYADVSIPNNNVFQASYPQDGSVNSITFNAEKGTDYYLCLNISAVSQPGDRTEGFFTLSLCTEKSHIRSKESIVLTESTCETAGSSGQVCELCGHGTNLVELPALGHTFGEEAVLEAVTCTTDGINIRVCSTCGKEEVTSTVEAHGHTVGTPVEVRTPTCTEDGNWEYYCTVCNALVNRETIPALGHQPDAYFTSAAASCNTDGLRTQYCTVCAALLQQEVIPAAGHIPGSMQVLKAATCVEDGAAEQRCTICNVVVASETLFAQGHVPGEFIQVRSNDILQTGLLTSSCQTCGEVLDSIEIPAIGQFLLRMDHPARFHMDKSANLSVVRADDMVPSEANANEYMSVSLQGQKLVVEEKSDSKRSNLAYVPFTAAFCVPAKTCFVATYTFDMTASKRATNGSAMLMAKLIDLGYADMQPNAVFDPGALGTDALVSLASSDYRNPAAGNAVLKVAFNNPSDEPQLVEHYFALFAGINYASTYAHRLLTEMSIAVELEDMTASYAEGDLLEFINQMH